MLENLQRLPEDAILGLMAAYRADTDPGKVDLGVGVYRDERGETPVLGAVRRAEAAVLARQTTKSYVSPIGNAEFNRAMEMLVLADSPACAAGRTSAGNFSSRQRCLGAMTWLCLFPNSCSLTSRAVEVTRPSSSSLEKVPADFGSVPRWTSVKGFLGIVSSAAEPEPV